MIKMKDNSKIVISGIKDLELKAINTGPLMLKIAEDMKTKVDMRFKQSKDVNNEPFSPLQESTISRRRKRSDKPLIDTGSLRNSINSKSTNNTAIAGTNKIYAKYQNFEAAKGSLGTEEVTQNVREFTRTRRGKRERVRSHTRKRTIDTPWGDKPARQFIGFSKSQIIKYRKEINKFLKGGK